jgi:quercetin dioxygenase-like cupin family protein
MMPSMRKWLSLVGSAAMLAIPTTALPQQLPSGVRSVPQFSGDVQLAAKPGTASVPVTVRLWTMAPGSKIDDLRLGAVGSLVVEVQSGELTAAIDGERQQHRLGQFFVIPAGQAAAVAASGNRSVVLRTVLVPPP